MKKKRWGKKFKDNRDWKQYNEKLVKRGEFYVNPRFLDSWLDEIKELNHRKVGQPYVYPPSMIEFLGVLRSKGFDFRALQGIMRAFARRLGPFPVISFSQIRRRIKQLPLSFHAKSKNLVVASDGSGLKVSNRGEWMRQKWQIRRGWIKVVIMGDIKGNIVDIRIGNEDLDERAASRGMIRKNQANIDKILLDAPCTADGTMGKNPRLRISLTNEDYLKYSRKQKELITAANAVLKDKGVLVYSTCSLAPEENEEVVQYLLDNFNLEILPIELPLKTRPGLESWNNKKFSPEMNKAVRIYPQDNNTEGFFLCKMRLKE